MYNTEGKAIAFPFSINSSGSINYVENDDETIWRDRVRFVVLTQLSERVMRPDFGSDINSLVFEGSWSVTTLAEGIVSTAFAKWLPKLTLNRVTTTLDDLHGGINVEIDYTLPNGITQTMSAQTASLNRYGDIVQGG